MCPPTAAFLAPVLFPIGLCAMDIPTALHGTNVLKLSWPQLYNKMIAFAGISV